MNESAGVWREVAEAHELSATLAHELAKKCEVLAAIARVHGGEAFPEPPERS